MAIRNECDVVELCELKCHMIERNKKGWELVSVCNRNSIRDEYILFWKKNLSTAEETARIGHY